ncbi:Hypothetical protein R9X50_00508300 [Acrodontium crateriforme]|uniref:Dynactin subunit 6 n=1 Tax=Acrodontium crateriforme TaxID=150365 RepID=A0AAQ3M790_9PEZI|nr:Hypothetical protein R9X50_00508300 [Acrodontium crateriforme]
MASTSAPAKKPASSSTVPAIKTPCRIHSTAVIADKVQITGPHAVEIGENAVLQPHVKLRAEGGKIIIGKNTTVAEKAIIGFAAGQGEGDIVIGDYVHIDAGTRIEASRIGDGSSIEVNSVIGKGAVVGKDCKVTALNVVNEGEELPDFTVVFCDGQRRIDQTMKDHAEIRTAKRLGQERTVALLQRLIPNVASKWL